MTWPEAIAKVRSFAAFADDWDGEGSSAFAPAHIEEAVAVAERMQSHHRPPTMVVPTVNHEISFEWYDNGYEQWFVKEPA